MERNGKLGRVGGGGKEGERKEERGEERREEKRRKEGSPSLPRRRVRQVYQVCPKPEVF